MIERLKSAKGSAFLLTIVVLFGSGYAYRGCDDAISQRFTWFSFMNGGDIRAACVPVARPATGSPKPRTRIAMLTSR